MTNAILYKIYEHNYQDTIIVTRHTDYLAEFDLQQQVTGTDDDWSVGYIPLLGVNTHIYRKYGQQPALKNKGTTYGNNIT